VTAVAVEADGVGPDAGVIGGEVGAAIEGVVTRLPFKQRVAFLQRKIHGLDYGAIGLSLRCSAESARAHVFQALRKIRQALDGQSLPEKRESQR
jgi:DNA-directed RNA polymerase specialized sigma24 family protein